MKLLVIGRSSGAMGSAINIAHDRGADVMSVESTEAGLEVLRSDKASDMVMIDVDFDIGGFIEQIRLERISVPVVACGMEGTDSKIAALAITRGANEYIPLPPDPEVIATILEIVTGHDDELVYNDVKMQEVVDIAIRVADKNATVLITGESGTGKEVLARFIHKRSKRSKGRFVAVNCAAIPDSLLESELFGHEKGAFSGAIAARAGRFEDADKGTLLLDEISEMDPRLQAKLLRVIQEREVDRLGGNKSIPVDIRLLATSNQNLAQAIYEKKFREDLYYRLSVVSIELPSLRSRVDDIEVLSRYFSGKFCDENGMKEKQFGEGSIEKLQSHIWPGNVRELENTIHRAVLLSDDDVIFPHDITFSEYRVEDGAGLVGRSVEDVEKDLILRTVDSFGYNDKSASVLGISLRILREKLDRYERGKQVK